METNVTTLLKSKKITDFMNKFIDKSKFKAFQFKFEVKKYDEKEIGHKNFQLLGTTIDYYLRFQIAKYYHVKMTTLIAEKSLYLMKIHLLDFMDEEDNLIYNIISNIIKQYKSLDVDLNTFPFLNLGMVDLYFRTGYFDKYNFLLQFNQYSDYLKNNKLITPLIDDYISVKRNIQNLGYATKFFRLQAPIYLNPNLTQKVSNTLVKGDADLLDIKTLWEIKTTLNKKIPISYIRQLLIYYWLIKRLNGNIKTMNFGIINTRAKNFMHLRISDVLNVEPRAFLLRFDAFMRKELKNAI